MITRREMFSRGMAAYFGGSFGCMKVLSGCGEVHGEKGAQKLPIVMLELGAKHHEDGIVTNLEASGISVGLRAPDSGVKRCEHGARSAECLQRAV